MAQDIAKEMMVAIPAPLVVERDEEQIGPLQLLHDEVAVCLVVRGWSVFPIPRLPTPYPQDRITQRPAHPVEDGGLEQKLLNMRRLAVKDLIHQVIGHKSVTTGECRQKAAVIRSILQ